MMKRAHHLSSPGKVTTQLTWNKLIQPTKHGHGSSRRAPAGLQLPAVRLQLLPELPQALPNFTARAMPQIPWGEEREMLITSDNSLDFIYTADQQEREVNTGGNLNSVKAQSCNPGSSLRAHRCICRKYWNLKRNSELELPRPASSNVFLIKTALPARRFQGWGHSEVTVL